jgi:hypothetical protein
MILARKLIALLLTFLPVVLHAEGCLRSIIIADTLDTDIGYTCVSDAYRLKKSLYSICSQLHLKPEVTILNKKKCRSVDLVRWLRSQTQSDGASRAQEAPMKNVLPSMRLLLIAHHLESNNALSFPCPRRASV